MNKIALSLFFTFVLYVGSALAWADPPQFPHNARLKQLL